MNQNMLCSELEFGYFVGSIFEVLIPYAFGAVSESNSSTYDLHTTPSGIQVLNFRSLDYKTRFLNEGFDLVSSENHKVVDFISTKHNPKFLINKAAVELFEQLLHLHNNLEELGNKVIDKRLVVTGQSLGGYLAILFTLWLHHVIDVKRKSGSKITIRPILLVPSSFACKHTTFDDPEAILSVLDTMPSSSPGSNPSSSGQMYDYKNELSSIGSQVLSRGVCEFDEFNSNVLRAGITLQFSEVGVLDKISNDLIEKLMEGKCEKMKKKSLDTYSDEKKLIKRKIKMAYMEWFISSTRSRVGYYDCFKSGPTKEENPGYQEIIKSHVILNQYWENFVKEKELTPQNGVRKRLLYSANNYRRMFEPVDIAKYYKKGNINYIENRPNHYKVLEEWWNEDKKDLNPSERKIRVLMLTRFLLLGACGRSIDFVEDLDGWKLKHQCTRNRTEIR
ncbi:hypothetical protein L1987_46730 [Smallanthus sonchifolius]|uniref:Uncharacterized protein n=1 Tax=Smallanthus sonchifolius TaxID=185202 RepID=A0ACB9G175_9ASTR|nr:hypothetical protein L1987_46730 [Smallanthus sonchifolius]